MIFAAVGASAGEAVSAAESLYFVESVGASTGEAEALGEGVALTLAEASSDGVGEALADGEIAIVSFAPVDAESSGSSAVTGVGFCLFGGMGSSVGEGVALGVSGATAGSVGASAGSSVVDFKSPVIGTPLMAFGDVNTNTDILTASARLSDILPPIPNLDLEGAFLVDSGFNDSMRIYDTSSDNIATVSANLLSTGRSYELPNADGTLALFSQIPVVYYGGFYQDDTSTVIALTQNTYTNVTGNTAMSLSGMTFSDPSLTLTHAGKYLVNWSISGKLDSGTNDNIEGVVFQGATEALQTSAHMHVANANDIVSMGGSGILTVTANDTVSLRLKNESSNNDFKVDHLNLTITRLTA